MGSTWSEAPLVRLPSPDVERRAARLRMFRLAGPQHAPGTVAKADQRTSLAAARAALSLACGAAPEDIDPAAGTWDG